jgi:hypothetical protein
MRTPAPPFARATRFSEAPSINTTPLIDVLLVLVVLLIVTLPQSTHRVSLDLAGQFLRFAKCAQCSLRGLVRIRSTMGLQGGSCCLRQHRFWVRLFCRYIVGVLEGVDLQKI